jgi:hypothetical protein
MRRIWGVRSHNSYITNSRYTCSNAIYITLFKSKLFSLNYNASDSLIHALKIIPQDRNILYINTVHLVYFTKIAGWH